jgi:hypothetical protein
MDLDALKEMIATKDKDLDLLLDTQKQIVERLGSQLTGKYAPTHNPTDEEAISALGSLEALGEIQESEPMESEIRALTIIYKWAATKIAA